LKRFNKIYTKYSKWLSPFLLGFIPAIITNTIQPISFLKYNIEPLRLSSRTEWFDDLEGDGKKEMIALGNFEGRMYIYLYTDNEQLLGQFNFSYPTFNPDHMPLPVSYDFNGDKIKDIVLFSRTDDSVFLNIFDYTTQNNLIETQFITTIGGFNDRTDYHIPWIQVLNVNNKPTLYFAVNGGYALYPRRIFGYNYTKNAVFSSINLGTRLNGVMFPKQDSDCVILCTGHAYGNTSSDYPYPYLDTCCWLMGFDQNLKIAFTPKPLASYPASIYPIKLDNENIYFTTAKIGNCPEMNKLYKMDFHGNIIDSKTLNYFSVVRKDTIKIKNKYHQIVLNGTNNEYQLIDLNKLEFKSEKKLKKLKNKILYYTGDWDKNGEREYLFGHLNKQITIYSSNLKKVGEFIADGNYQRHFSYRLLNNEGELLLSSQKGTMHYSVKQNPYYKLKYALWLGIYLISVFFVWLLLYFQRRNINKRLQLEKQIAEVQLQNLRNQLDPHFTFNALNSVGNAIYKQDKEQAYKLFQRFTRMIRSSLLVSDQVFRTLDEELQFTRDYMEFQKTRFKELFDYYIEVDETINLQALEIPKMLIQSFAENAVKHAFADRDSGGKLWIKVHEEKGAIRVIIEDNGIGINKSKEQGSTSGTQKGEKILMEQVEKINTLYNKSYRVKINDLSDIIQNTSGTRVTVTLKD